MEKYESALKFEKYIVNEIHFITNKDFKSEDNKIPLNLKISKKTEIEENNHMKINLNVNVFKGAREYNYPYEIEMNITGYFSAQGEKVERFEKNAIAILYPYVRSIISTYTANANVTPLLLQAINVNKLIEQQSKEEN